ncbi:MAG TPA: glycine cleavage system protein GcvH [Gemmatimonadales bacterium]|jgi:glycine cleavage system H protein|nr:glycine cleavage system protein GcvH [Gemmatimonadales bacterium]
MSSIPKDLRYTKDHEWVRESDDPQVVEVGITDYAQGELGDVVFVELPKAATAFKQRDTFGTIEAVKAVSELYSPVAGMIVEANKALQQDPALVNRDPYGQGWMVKVKLKDPKELEGLLRADAYAKHVGE